MFKNLVNRLRNQAFTTSSDYDIKLSVGGGSSYTDAQEKVVIADAEVFVGAGLSEKEAEAIVLYASAHESTHIKYSNVEPLRALSGVIKEKGYNPKMLAGLIQVAEDLRIDTKATQVLPGYADLRETTLASAIKLFSDEPSDSLEANYTKELSFRTHGNTLESNKLWQTHSGVDFGLAKTIYENITNIVANNMGSSGELIDAMVDYYDKELSEIFDTPPEDEQGKGEPENQEGDNNDENELDTEGTDASETDDNDDDNSEQDYMDSLEQSFKGEGTYEELIGETASKEHKSQVKSITSDSEEAQEALDDRIASVLHNLFDDYHQLLSPQEKAEKIKAINTDMHRGMEPLYGRLKQYKMDSIKRDTLAKVDASTIELHRGTGRELGNKLKQLLKAETSFRGDLERTGHSINAKKVWKALHTSDTKVFNSRERTETGNFVIDLLIDGSGSQSYRENSVRQQAFILAEALKHSGIAHKISFFHSHREVQLLHILRHYDTKEFDTTDVFSYRARGDNRDGYFIKAVTHDIEQRPEEHKVIIVLSDGQPACSNSHEWRVVYDIPPDFWYDDDIGVGDTRAQVNAARDKGIAVMGMYVGDDPITLRDEKAMYGSDFVYLGTKVDNFSSIAIKSLAKHIQSIMIE